MRRTIGIRAILAYSFVLLIGTYSLTLLAQDAPPASDTLTVEESIDLPAEESKPQQTLLDTLMDGGVVGALIGVLSIVAFGFIVEHFLSIRKDVLMPEDIATTLSDLVEEGKIDEAIEVCQHPGSRSLLAYVVESGLTRYRSSEFGFAEYKAAVEEAGEEQTGQLYRKIEVLGLIGQIAPMLGLTGTVLGMINAFNTIAATDGAPKPAELADAIGQALVTTLLGLVVAIPAMVAYSFFGNRIDSLVSEAGKRVEQILTPLGRRR